MGLESEKKNYVAGLCAIAKIRDGAAQGESNFKLVHGGTFMCIIVALSHWQKLSIRVNPFFICQQQQKAGSLYKHNASTLISQPAGCRLESRTICCACCWLRLNANLLKCVSCIITSPCWCDSRHAAIRTVLYSTFCDRLWWWRNFSFWGCPRCPHRSMEFKSVNSYQIMLL